MNKRLQKQHEQPEKKKAVRQNLVPEGGPVQAEDLEQVWTEEIEALQTREFDSIEAAVAAVIDAVVDRLKMTNEDGIREFLSDLFKDDPAVEERLRKALRVR